jgi:hypothetical protein
MDQRRASSVGSPWDPIPDPVAAGWTKEGREPHVPAATSLFVHDLSHGGFCRFFVPDAAAFGGEIELNPRVLLTSFSAAAGADTGVHVARDDGVRRIRAAVLAESGLGVRVALALGGAGYTRGFVLPTVFASFRLKRLVDGSAFLTAAGGTPEIVDPFALPGSRRSGVQTIEFGADAGGETVSAEWFTLGLPPAPHPLAFALTVDRIQLRGRG